MATGSTLTRWYVDGIFGSITCKSIHFVAQVSPAVSSQSFVWIAIDRFVAILFPVRLGLVSRKIRVIAIASTWILAAAINSNHLVSQDLHIRDNKTFCEVKLVSAITEETYFAIFYYMQLFLNTFGSFFLSVVLYTAIAVSLHKQSKALANSGPNIQRNVFKKRKRAIQLSAVTMVTYILPNCYHTYAFLFATQKGFSISLQRNESSEFYGRSLPIRIDCDQSCHLFVVCSQLSSRITKYFMLLLQDKERRDRQTRAKKSNRNEVSIYSKLQESTKL